MKHISILVPNGNVILSSVVGAFKVFSSANMYMMKANGTNQPAFNIDLVGTKQSTELYGGLFEIRANKTVDEIEKTDLVVITTIRGDMDLALAENREFIPWLKKQRVVHNAELASLCGGAFLLAETGFLNGKLASTHWSLADEFRERYPKVNLQSERVITEDNGIYTSGGAYSFLNLMLHLAEKYAGREAAIWISKMLEIEFDRDDQNQFVIFEGQKDHADEAVRKAQHYIEQNLGEKLSVEELADGVAISRRNFVRRFKKATANTPLEYIQRVRVEAAKKFLESSTLHVGEVMTEVGYMDTKAFRNIFKKYTGMSPQDYRRKYNRELQIA